MDVAAREVDLGVRLLFRYAALADKYDGCVHSTTGRYMALALNEAWGVPGIDAADETPFGGLVSLLAPAIAMGHRVVAIVSERHPLVVAELYQALDTSDVPAGVVNLIGGPRDDLLETLASHDDVDALRCGALAIREPKQGRKRHRPAI